MVYMPVVLVATVSMGEILRAPSEVALLTLVPFIPHICVYRLTTVSTQALMHYNAACISIHLAYAYITGSPTIMVYSGVFCYLLLILFRLTLYVYENTPQEHIGTETKNVYPSYIYEHLPAAYQAAIAPLVIIGRLVLVY
jgi:hypothetical protein